MTHQDIANYALEKLLKAGADKAACSATRGRKDEFNVEANDFSLLRTLFNDGLSLKAIKDGRKGVTIINKLEKDAIDQAVEQCISMALSAEPDEADDIAEKVENKKFDRRLGGADMQGVFNRTKEFVEQVGDEFPKIGLEAVTADFNSSKVAYMNSNGVEFYDDSEHYSSDIMFTAKDGEKTSSFNAYESLFTSTKIPLIDMGMLRTLLDESVRSLDTRMVEGKFVGKVILTPACDDMIWGTLLDNFLSDMSLVTETSRWKDALRTQVTDSKLTMRFSPFRSDAVAGERFTADGYLSEDMDIIRDGILDSFALSLYGSRKTGKPRARNTASANLEVLPGTESLNDMVKGVERGILLNRFSGANPGVSGDISGIAKNSFLIENGVITDALSETMLSFNIVDILQNIPAISKERCSDGSSLLPWCCFDGITISGK
jgi:PmbA protein